MPAARPPTRPRLTRDDLLARMEALADPDVRAGQARVGINTARAYGVKVTALRVLARAAGRDHDLALALWQHGAHEARLLATMLAEPSRADRDLLDAWVAAIDSWDLCGRGRRPRGRDEVRQLGAAPDRQAQPGAARGGGRGGGSDPRSGDARRALDRG
jgi:hypothetical protein